MTNNTINSNIPIEESKGGTGVASITQHSIVIGGATTLTEISPLTDGQLIIGYSGSTPLAASLVSADASITITPSAGGVDLASSGGGSIDYTVVTGSSQAAAVNSGYIANNAATAVSFTIPVTAAIGDSINIIGKGSAKYEIYPSAGSSIKHLDDTATTGTHFIMTNAKAAVEIISSTTNVDWTVTNVEDSTPGMVLVDNIAFLAAGALAGYAMKKDGISLAWGYNEYGQLGDQTRTNYSSPVTIAGNHSFVSIVGGVFHAVGLKSDGQAWCWGDNFYGQLGDQTTDNKSSPIAVVGSHVFEEIASESMACGGRKANGSIWTWGQGLHGQLGDQTGTDKSSPVAVVGNHSFIKVSAGQNGSVKASGFAALKEDGSVWCWGDRSYGRNGDQTTTDKSSPVLVVGNHNFVDLYSGEFVHFGLKADGSCWGWGYNLYGQLGDQTTDNKSSPTLVVGNHSFIKVIGCGTHTLGLKKDGSSWSWGGNLEGELADGSTTARSSPVLVVGNFLFSDIAGGGTRAQASSQGFSYGLENNGIAWSWGYNLLGYLGDQTTTNKSSPVRIVGLPL